MTPTGVEMTEQEEDAVVSQMALEALAQVVDAVLMESLPELSLSPRGFDLS